MLRIVVALLMYVAVMSIHAQAQNDTLLVCGHRGGFYNMLPENSLSAIRYTADNCLLNPVVVEVDVRKSKDGTLYVLHDETVDRTTNGKVTSPR